MRSIKKRLSGELDVTHGENDFFVTFDWDLELDYDPRYGADADGNRGVPMWTREGNLVAITAVRFEDKLIDVDMQSALGNAISAAVDEYIDNPEHDPESRDDEEPDPDRYRDDPDRGDW